MPGLTFAFSPFSDRTALVHSFEEAQKTMLHGPHYQACREFVHSTCALGHVAYAEYPVETFSEGTVEIYVEGRIYNVEVNTLRADLLALAGRVFQAEGRSEFVRNWIESHDGEYVIVVLEPDKRKIAVITDPLGRLPLFYHHDDRSLVLARECKFITHFTGDRSFDKIGCGQFLWAGYPLGNRTLFKSVNLAPPAMLLVASVQGSTVTASIEDVLNFNVEDKDTSSKSADDYASDLVQTILSTTYDRGHYPGYSTNVMSLSGGWDSRVVAAALARTNSKAVAVTYVNSEGRGTTDAKYAVRIAAALGLECEYMKIRAVRAAEEDRLVYMTDGLNFVTMAYNLPFMEQLVLRFGRKAMYVTGDGGPQVVSLKGLRRSVSSMEELLRELIGERTMLPIGTAEEIIGLPHGTLADELYNVVSKYPENDMNQRGARFAIYERGRRWGFEGEDRARFFMWETTPFYAYPFFRCGLRIPDRFKRDNRMYRLFQIKLAREAARVPDANTGIAPASAFYPYMARFKRYLITSHAVRQFLKPLLLREEFGRRKEISGEALTYLNHAADSNDGLMSASAVNEMLTFANQTQYDNWWTLALLDKHVRRGAYGKRACAQAKLA